MGPAVEQLFPDIGLRPGQTRGISPEMSLRLNPPPVPTWALWSTAAVGAGAGVATVASGVVWGLAQESYRALGETARSTPVSGVDVKSQESTVITAEAVTWTLLGTTAVAGVAAAAMVPFVDWDGYGASE